MVNFPYRWSSVVVLTVVLLLLLTAAGVLLIRGNSNAPIQILAPTPSAESSNPLTVYVSGAVNQPGVYSILPGARLADGVNAAGGATSEGDLSAVNLAQRLRDEAHYHIPRAGEAPLAVAAPASSSPEPGARINLNTAGVDQLLSLNGIGQVKAKAIVDYRQQNGPFRSVEDVVKVPGIGRVTYEKIRSSITVGGGSP